MSLTLPLHSGAGGFQTFDISNPDAPHVLNSTKYTITPKPGADEQQNKSRIHEVILDPTGDFIAAPDLGGDLIRTYKIDKTTLEYVEGKTFPTPDLSSPRHGAFVKLESGTYFYVVTERSNQIIGWKVDYKNGGLDFGKELFIIPSHGPGAEVDKYAKGAELVISVSSTYSHSSFIDQGYTNHFTHCV